MIGHKPADVNNNLVDELRERRHRQKKPPKGKQDIALGDKVRISKVKSIFAKGYLPNWTEEIFTVAAINTKYTPTTYMKVISIDMKSSQLLKLMMMYS